ncbi:MAG TPA: family 10 glycosylhydrolase [Verrucomicrobiae bacterium]|nr:family 10 glycosylhydrolase [Verrucomicrobiae bacterium]
MEFFGFFWLFLVCSALASDSPPPVPREFRALWVATVNNIDWPSRPGLTTREQKEELLAIIDRAAALHLNAIIFQVRTGCDALYDSKIEPWSEYLTGKVGQPPSPFYDPLGFAIAEAHKRGLELHAWFNPYRVQSANIRHPELIRAYGKNLWLDPAEQATRDYSLSVIMDVVRRYDIDGVHFDDYFYPYPEKSGVIQSSKDLDFPDDGSWRRYQAKGGKLSRNDWRRENVNQFIELVFHSIKREKRWVKFGISPFGIWRPGSPRQISGFDAYDKLFGDSRKWLENGWVDYLAPQLYWPIDQKAQSFPVLLQWWNEQNPLHRHLWPGMRISGWHGVNDDAAEMTREIELTRKEDNSPGVILWHARPLMRNEAGLAEALGKNVYRTVALVPAYPWLTQAVPASPHLSVHPQRDDLKVEWRFTNSAPWQWLVQKKIGGKWTAEILPEEKTSETIKADSLESVAVTAINRYGNTSVPAIYHPER